MYNNLILLAPFYLFLINYIAAENIMHGSEITNSGNVVLSRKKRYLVFPDGTSLQLVYCFTIPVPNYIYIWTYGFTVSSAWLLPTKPEDILHHRKKEEPEERIDEPSTTLVEYIESVNKIANKNKYTHINYAQSYMPFYSHKDYYDTWRRPYYQPNERRIYTHNRNRDQKYEPPREKIVYEQNEYHRHPLYTKLHRISRRDLYSKLEQFFSAQKKDGKACLLKAICEVGKSADDGGGSFMEEIVKTVFRNKLNQFEDEMDEYDRAANNEHDCDQMYPACTESKML